MQSFLLLLGTANSSSAQTAIDAANATLSAYDERVRQYKSAHGHNVTLQLDDPCPEVLSTTASAPLSKSVDILTRLLRKQPKQPRVRPVLARIFSRFGRANEAVKVLQRHVLYFPRDADGWNQLGAALARSGDADLSRRIECYRRAARLKPDNASAWANLGNALASAGQPAEAVRAGKRAVALEPKYVYAWMNLGVAYGLLNDWPNEEKAYLNSIRVPPTYEKCPFARFNLALGYEHAGQLDKAVEYYRDALTVGLPQGPRSRQAALFHHNLARALFRKGDFADSAKEATESLRIDPKLPEPYSLLGHLFGKAGDEATAKRMFAAATKLLAKYGPSTADQPQRHAE